MSATDTSSRGPLLTMRGIVKTFPGVRALDGVTFDVNAGEVHALVGENGAGKSTLMKILAGAQPADSGEITVDGQTVAIDSPKTAERLGIGMIYQEFNLVPDLGVIENIVLGVEPRRGLFLDRAAAANEAAKVLGELGIVLPLDRKARRLSVAEQQLTEIAKCLVRKARLIVMDEPTAALTDREITALFALIAKLKAQNVAFVYISHRLEELPRIADRVTVLRDGKAVETRAMAQMPPDDVIRLMVGRALENHFPELPPVSDDAPVVLDVRGVSAVSSVRVNEVAFQVHAGEIVGLAGLVGAGRTEIVRAIAGADIPTKGEIRIDGKRVIVRSPRSAIAAGIALITSWPIVEGRAQPAERLAQLPGGLAACCSAVAQLAGLAPHRARATRRLYVLGPPTATWAPIATLVLVLPPWLAWRSPKCPVDRCRVPRRARRRGRPRTRQRWPLPAAANPRRLSRPCCHRPGR